MRFLLLSGMGFNPILIVLSLLFLRLHGSVASPDSIIRILPEGRDNYSHRKIPREVYQQCESWRFTVETNDAGPFSRIPSECASFVKDYVTGYAYISDSEAVADASIAFAKTVQLAGDGKDVWIFDVDETLLSNLPYYADHGFGSEIFDEKIFNAWIDLAEAPVLPASLRLYRELLQLGFKIVLLTGRDESQREVTEKNLYNAGYSNWERLLLRGPSDRGKTATLFKSEKRKELEDAGYRIQGSSGDQWSDLNGFAVATRSFKLPNPMYSFL
ncbi:OLC1v1037590C1 [Oldenlandia corymbosa var. corymbosa]|uniref:OLC1v1037590C1 n=1 Tax=Oldenlandia corymbosa var. corymbosa TaxID=529605 RepID=A0AAV1CYE0_OLDCO|nr:OLC1v1037590C1 [Oldenlandia corymbosa var. corymbosa]